MPTPYSKFVFVLSLISTAALAQTSLPLPRLTPPATLPIQFTRTISAQHAHVGDTILARTTQPVKLAAGGIVPAGSRVTGHVVAASSFMFNPTPYAQQLPSRLSIHFDSVDVAGAEVPLQVTVRAMADTLASEQARTPAASDMDSLGTLTQIGGDQLVPSQSEVRDMRGDVVAYQRSGMVYAHLISKGHCDSSDVELPVGLFAASACGLYGFPDVVALEYGSSAAPSTLTLISARTSACIWERSTALLELLPEQARIVATGSLR